ncbi:GNAT family N-acetyltransferase [Halovivax limisalsi]|uniref:GNAT family N-acetyltransferase n=1 Tax=Halovivax limisalsi TaxID=1453760 RepID=UPI001FFD7FEE|nr:GNAT family N-acetyltransferase [Halovivax limisalsi]
MDVRELTDEAERRAAVPLVRQLWSEASADEVLAWTAAEEYHLFGGVVDGELVGVAGVVVTDFLHHARHAWLYDLVVDEPRRGAGHGTTLVEFVEEWAADRGCESVALASPLEKPGVHRYYESQGYERWGYVIEKEL